MSSKSIDLRFVGASPLIMHSGRFVDPSYWASKEIKAIASKRSKTEADLAEMARIEFLGSLYLNEQQEPVLPDILVEAALVNGAKKLKLGPAAKAGLLVEGHAILDYEGPRSPEELYKQERHRLFVPARIGQARVMRMRPIFPDWAATIRVQFLDELLSESRVVEIAIATGAQVGLGDWRPKHGRFAVEVVR